MVGFMFTLCLLCILAFVGFLFAWMVRLASFPESRSTEKGSDREREKEFAHSVESKQL